MEGLLAKHVGGGVLYTAARRNGWPLLAVHGLGGHHAHFRHLHVKIREAGLGVWPCYVDLPGFGHSRGRDDGLSAARSFLAEAYGLLCQMSGQPVVLLHISASIWFTVGHYDSPYVSDEMIIAVNPVRIPRPDDFDVEMVDVPEFIDVRHEYLALFFPPEEIRRMDRQSVGGGMIAYRTLRDLLSLQSEFPLAGWRRVVSFESTRDPLKELRLDVGLSAGAAERVMVSADGHGLTPEVAGAVVAELGRGEERRMRREW